MAADGCTPRAGFIPSNCHGGRGTVKLQREAGMGGGRLRRIAHAVECGEYERGGQCCRPAAPLCLFSKERLVACAIMPRRTSQ
jgi:hypothetical protein